MRTLHANEYGNMTYSFADDTTFVGAKPTTEELQIQLQDWTDKFK